VDLRDVDAAWFRARIGVVSQDPRLFSMTIRENIAYGLHQVLSRMDVAPRPCCCGPDVPRAARFLAYPRHHGEESCGWSNNHCSLRLIHIYSKV